MKEFFDALYGMKAVERRDLLEKDYHMHRILAGMVQDPWTSEHVVFKGGTVPLWGMHLAEVHRG